MVGWPANLHEKHLYRQQWKTQSSRRKKWNGIKRKVDYDNTGSSFTKESHYSVWLFMYLFQSYPNLCGLGSGQGFPCLYYFFPAKLLGYAVSSSGEGCSVLFFLAFKWALSWLSHSLLDNSVLLLFKSIVLELHDTLWHTRPDQALEVLTMILHAIKLHLIYHSVLIVLTKLCFLCMSTRTHNPYALKWFFGGVL